MLRLIDIINHSTMQRSELLFRISYGQQIGRNIAPQAAEGLGEEQRCISQKPS